MPVLTHLGPAAPCGLHRYESDAFGKEYTDNLFACQFNLHKVSRHVLTPSGATFTTEDSDFLVSRQPRLPPDRRDRGRRRQPARDRHRRLVQALLPDLAAREAGRAGGDLPGAEGGARSTSGSGLPGRRLKKAKRGELG